MNQVNEELRAARSTKYVVPRVSALTALLPRLSPLDQPTVVAEILADIRRFKNPYLQATAFLELLPHLSSPDKDTVLVETSRAASQVSDRQSRSLVFAHLAPLLPERDRPFALIEAWLGTAPLKTGTPAQALIDFMLKQTDPAQHEVFEEALDAVQELHDADVWLAAMKLIVRYLPEPLLQSVAKASQGLRDASKRVETLLKLAADLPGLSKRSILTDALQVTRSEAYAPSRAHGLHLLSSVLQETEKKELLSETLEAIRAISSPEEQTRALARLLPDLPTDLLEEGFSIAVAIKNINSRSRAISELAPLLPDFFQERVVDAIRKMHTRQSRVNTLLALARVQPKLFLNELRNQVLEIVDAERRAEAFVQVAQLSAESERHAALVSAISAARLINDKIRKARLLIEIATDLPEHERSNILGDALNTIQSIEPTQQRVEVLRELARRVPQYKFSLFLELVYSTHLIPETETLKGPDDAELGHFLREPMEEMKLPKSVSVGLSKSISVGYESGHPRAERPPRLHVVNTGFAQRSDPTHSIDPTTSLSVRESYFFWVEVGVPDPKSIELSPTGLPAFSETVRLKVAIASISGELMIDPNAAVGELELRPDGSVSIISQPAHFNDSGIETDWLDRRLFFPIQPRQIGLSRFRCNVYYKQILVQSRLISARISEQSRQMHQALRSELDYTLSGTLDPTHLKKLTPHQMSLLLAAAERTFTFSFFCTSGGRTGEAGSHAGCA